MYQNTLNKINIACNIYKNTFTINNRTVLKNFFSNLNKYTIDFQSFLRTLLIYIAIR